MRFHGLDLNLLVALDALLAERSVTLAAERLCLSQSATSNALNRLRDYFGDDLLVLRGRAMVLTARGSALIEPVRVVFEQIARTITVPPSFDPVQSDRHVRIMASDYVARVLLAPVIRDLRETAPHMRVEILSMADAPVDYLERNQIDLLLTLNSHLSPDHPSEILFEDDHVVIGWDQNPALCEPLSREAYFALGHVGVRFGKNRTPTFDEDFLRRVKPARRLEVISPCFSVLPEFLLGTQRVATVYRHLALSFARTEPIAMQELPITLPPIREGLQWHIGSGGDEALRWIARRIREGAQALRAGRLS